GQLVPGMEALVMDPETGASLGPHETGELWLRGPNCFDGYLNNAEATGATIDGDGWLHTGDLCHFDEDGFLFVTDRLKELIKVKGFQVPPAELEALVIGHPEVADVAVIGVPDDESGERPKAFVVRAPGAALDAEGLKAFVAEHVATYKQLHEVVFVDSIPKSASGKILRRLLRDGAA
ncbi:MAG: AMP-binding protein, partial [Myxococcales bacterium]|nr:AMP-binding protein [Myxococcales bacterium]